MKNILIEIFFENFNLGKIVLEFSEKRLISAGEKLKFRIPLTVQITLHSASDIEGSYY